MSPTERTPEEALAGTSGQTLLTTYAALTHRIHEDDATVRAGTGPRKGSTDYIVSTSTARAMDRLEATRAERNVMAAEILRRMGETP